MIFPRVTLFSMIFSAARQILAEKREGILERMILAGKHNISKIIVGSMRLYFLLFYFVCRNLRTRHDIIHLGCPICDEFCAKCIRGLNDVLFLSYSHQRKLNRSDFAIIYGAYWNHNWQVGTFDYIYHNFLS